MLCNGPKRMINADLHFSTSPSTINPVEIFQNDLQDHIQWAPSKQNIKVLHPLSMFKAWRLWVNFGWLWSVAFWAVSHRRTDLHFKVFGIFGQTFRKTYGSFSPGRGKWAKCVLFFSFFWSFTVTKRFDLFKFSQLFWRDYVRWSLKII